MVYTANWGMDYATYHLLGEPETTIEYGMAVPNNASMKGLGTTGPERSNRSQRTCSTCKRHRGMAQHKRIGNKSYLGASKNRGGPPKSSILIGFSIISHPFWGTLIITYFWKHPLQPFYQPHTIHGTRMYIYRSMNG